MIEREAVTARFIRATEALAAAARELGMDPEPAETLIDLLRNRTADFASQNAAAVRCEALCDEVERKSSADSSDEREEAALMTEKLRCGCPGWTPAHWMPKGGFGCTHCRDAGNYDGPERGNVCPEEADETREHDDLCAKCAKAEQMEETR